MSSGRSPAGSIDSELVKRVQNGDTGAFETLVHRYSRLVMAVAYSVVRNVHAAEDVAQDSFFKAQRGIEGLRNPDRFRSWLSGITRKTAIDWVRKSRRNPDSLTAMTDAAGSVEDTRSENPSDLLVGSERGTLLQQALGELSEKYREVVVLKYLENLSYAEIAEVTNLTPSAVESLLHRAREKLRQKLKGLL